MSFVAHALEEWQSRYENEVAYNLAGSGVVPMSLRSLLADQAEADRILDTALEYPVVVGSRRLRELIAAWHGGQPDNVIVTVGGAEAAFLAVGALVGPGDHVVAVEPAYRQIRGCALNVGAVVTSVSGRFDRSWRLDAEALASATTPATRLITLVNPSNPTGTVLSDEEMDAVVRVAERSAAWLLVDEVCRGTERLMDTETPSFLGRYERAVCVGSLSKAFASPGLRTGWLIGPTDVVERAWRRHEYTVIATSNLSVLLAETVMSAAVRQDLVVQARAHVRRQYPLFQDWVDSSDGLLSIVAPEATSVGLVRYDLDLPSVELARRLREEDGVLVAPGALFGAEGHLRIAFGLGPQALEAALGRVLSALRRHRRAGNAG